MRIKLIGLFFFLFILSFVSLKNAPPSNAATFDCALSVTNIAGIRPVNFTIDGKGNFVNGQSLYRVSLNGWHQGCVSRYCSQGTLYSAVSGKITVSNATTYNGTFTPGEKINVNVSDTAGNACKTMVLTIAEEKRCKITLTSTSPKFTPNSTITIKTTDDLNGAAGDTHRVILKGGGGSKDGPDVRSGDICPSTDQLKTGFQIGKFTTGRYYLEVRNQCSPFGIGEKAACDPVVFDITAGGGGVVKETTGENIPSQNPCPKQFQDSKGFCTKVVTGLGITVNTASPAGFIRSLVGVLLAISGGIAVLLIIIAGYQILTSQGNPEKIQTARERLISAIVGLLFIIFSFVIFQVIVVDILRIPGFGQ